ncbi:MAG: ABC-type transport system, permease component [Symbiobacteriaceae bacterium]|jgi:ABC-2 type transport system permease protein|nr:ABC-type transport system, permease component [Symbiobacteriaceae bacterium]
MTLFRQHAKSEAISTLVWAAILGFIGFFTTYLWEMMSKSGSIAQLEKAMEGAQGVVKGLIGTGEGSFATLDGWIAGYVLGSWISLPYVIFTALFVAGMITREMDRRTIEFVLSLPVSRTEVLLSRFGVLASSLTVLHLANYIGVVAGVAAVGQAGHPGRYALAILNSLLLFLFLGALMLLVSLYIDDYGPGTGTMLGIGLGLNFFHIATADASEAIKSLREWLPFGLHDVNAIVGRGEVPWGDMALLGGGALLCLGLAVWAFQRKQIAV